MSQLTRGKLAYTQQIEELKRHIEEEVKVTEFENCVRRKGEKMFSVKYLSGFCSDYRPRTPWLMLSSQLVMTATSSESSMRRSRRPKLSCSVHYPKQTARWLSGGPNMKPMLFSALRSWRRQSKSSVLVLSYRKLCL